MDIEAKRIIWIGESKQIKQLNEDIKHCRDLQRAAANIGENYRVWELNDRIFRLKCLRSSALDVLRLLSSH